MPIPKQALLLGIGATTVTVGGIGVYFLSKDRTIEHKLVREGEKIINTQEEYEIAFMERKADQDLIKTIGIAQTVSELANGGNALRIWCEKNKILNLSEENNKNILPKVKKYCSKPSLTIKERYTKIKKKLIQGDKWKEKIKTLKEPNPKDPSIEEDLKLASLGDDNDNRKGGEALKKWCNEKIKIELSKDKEETIWKKVEKRCIES